MHTRTGELLLIRAVAEAMCSDSDQSVAAHGLGAAIQSGVVGYRLPPAEMEATFHDLVQLSLTRAPGLQLPLAIALLNAGTSEPGMPFARNMLLARAANFDEPMAYGAAVLLRVWMQAEQLQYLVERTKQYHRAHNTMSVLAGA